MTEIKTRGPSQLPLSNEQWEMFDGTPQRVYDRLNRLLALVLSSVSDAQEAQDTMAPVLEAIASTAPWTPNPGSF